MRGESDSFRFCRAETQSVSGKSAKPAAAVPDEKPVFHLLEKATGTWWLLFFLKDCSVASCDLAGTQAASADAHLLNAPVNNNVHGLDIRRPAALGLAMGMAVQIAGHGSFLADFTELTHSVHLLAKTRTLQYYHSVSENASIILRKNKLFLQFPPKLRIPATACRRNRSAEALRRPRSRRRYLDSASAVRRPSG